jgi:hypothetical protein
VAANFSVTDLELTEVQWVLPLVISFYTFTQIACLIDAWREDLSHCDYLSHKRFTTFFPEFGFSAGLARRDVAATGPCIDLSGFNALPTEPLRPRMRHDLTRLNHVRGAPSNPREAQEDTARVSRCRPAEH